MAEDKAQLLTAEEVTRYLRLHVKSVYRLAREGRIPGQKLGGGLRLHRRVLEQWVMPGPDAKNRGGILL